MQNEKTENVKIEKTDTTDNSLIYFPREKKDIEVYIERLLKHTIKKDYEAEKLFLYSLLSMLFNAEEKKSVANPETLLFLLNTVNVVDEVGISQLDKLFISDSTKKILPEYQNLYWFMKDTPNIQNTIIRLINIYQFYDNLFDAPILADNGKTFVKCPNSILSKKITIPIGVECVETYSFHNNANVNFVVIPKTVKTIRKNAFVNCVNIKGFIVDEENPDFFARDGVLYRKNPTIELYKYPSGLKNTVFTVSENVKKIKTMAFDNCDNLKEINIEYSQTKLENDAFFNCINIKSVSVLNGIVSDINSKGFNGTEFGKTTKNADFHTNSYNTDSNEDANATENQSLTPSEINKMFNEYIVGHEDAKKTLAVAVYSHILRCNNPEKHIGKSNILICGPTGCGKTEFARTVAKILDVPFVTADATSITEAGFKGNDPTDMLKDLLAVADNNLDAAQNGIIYIDEIDKLATAGENIHRESYSKGVQQSLLKVIEGGIIPVRIDTPMQQQTIQFDTTNVLFIVGGAFTEITTTATESEHKNIGFNKQEAHVMTDSIKKLEQKDFIKYGMTQEFMGRFPIIVQLCQLKEEDIYRIMIEPKNSVVSQYKTLVGCIGSDLTFDDELLHNIAKDAIKKGTGARGIRTVVEKLVEDVLFELPDKRDIKNVIIHNGVYVNKEKPIYK